jgi:Xaa-Pro aminopeptidase
MYQCAEEAVNGLFGQFDAEMEKRGLDTALVVGESTLGNPELLYVTGATIPRGGIFLKRKHGDPLLVVSNIDVGSAKRGRVRDVRTYSDFGYEKLLKKHGTERAYITLIDSILRSIHTRGRVAIYGRSEFSHLLSVADSLRKMGHKVTGERDSSLIDSLRETKDPSEVSRVRSVGLRAARVVHGTLEMLRECAISSGKLKHRRRTLTISAVKSRINVLLAEQDLMAPEGTVFAVGQSSADPHAMGEPSEPVRAGTPIVFDLFPVSPEGYWFDLTRTFVIGRANRKVKEMFQTVLDVQLRSMDLIREDMPARQVMNSACDIFERNGFKTIRATLERDKEAARIGFIHSLGHGVGLTIGERPYLGLFSDDVLRRNHLLTVEPGLYHPSVGGVRIEDTVLVKGRRIENLTPLEKELEI